MRRNHRNRLKVGNWDLVLLGVLAVGVYVVLGLRLASSSKDGPPPVPKLPAQTKAAVAAPAKAAPVGVESQYRRYSSWAEVEQVPMHQRAPMYWKNRDGTYDPVTPSDMRSLQRQFEHAAKRWERSRAR